MELPREAPRKEHERVMDENGTTPESSKVRHVRAGLPYKLVGAALLGVVLVLLGAAFFLNSRLRPPTTLEAVPSIAGTRATRVTPTVVPTTAPLGVTVPGVSTPPLTTSTAVLTTQVPPGVRVASSPLEREIEDAYLHYWQVRSDALLNLDTSHLGDVMAGPELARDIKQVEDLKAQSKAARVVITQHSIAFLKVSPDQAEIYDEYVNQSYLVDPRSKRPFATPGPGGVAKVSYQLQKINGVWKVTDGTRNN